MDRHYDQSNALAQQSVYAGMPSDTPRMTHTESVTNSLQNLYASLNDTGARLQEARDRMFGSQPTAGEKGAPQPVPNGRADEIDMLLSSCHDAAERNSILAGELMRRL